MVSAFQWIMKKVTKVFSRSTNSLFYTLLYREILKEIQEITKNEDDSVVIFREFGKRSAYESCERHSSIFKFMPGDPKKVLDYFSILWVIVFGMEIGDFSYETIPKKGKYNDYILTILKNPICAGYGNDPEDTFNFTNLSAKSEGCSSGLAGMLESVANFILKTKKVEFRISITERECIAKGQGALKLDCCIYDYSEWKKIKSSNVKERISSEVRIKEQPQVKEDGFVQETKLDFVEKIQDSLSLDKIEEILNEPLESIKEKVSEIIRDKLNMDPENFFDYFRNYEDDMLRIIGFLVVHLLNEYGGIIEKILKNDIFSKVVGYLFNHFKEMTFLFIPLDVANDYHRLLIDFLDGLAPSEMVDNIRSYEGKDDINFLFEGAGMALENLGVNFAELKGNVWEELKKERDDRLITADQSLIDQSQEKFPKVIQIIQEVLMLISEILTLPIRMIVSEGHYGVKTAVNSVISEEEGGLFERVKDRLDTIFDTVQELKM
ncbi:MAG: hypothetical protein ACFFAS_14325 [Promethearchaeota archaeon]